MSEEKIAVDPDLHSVEHGVFPSDFESETTSLASSIYRGVLENGRRAPADEQQFESLEIGDVADMYPEALVRGVDLYPPPIQWLPPNCVMEVDDVLKAWTWRQPFDLVHLRQMIAAFTREEWASVYQQCFENIEPGGWIEHWDGDPRVRCDDGSLPRDSSIVSFGQAAWAAAEKWGHSLDTCYTMRTAMENAGFVDIHEKVDKLPIGPWPKDRMLKEAGRLHFHQWTTGLEGWAMYLLTKHGCPHPWSKEEVHVLVAKVRAEIQNPMIHVYQYVKRGDQDIIMGFIYMLTHESLINAAQIRLKGPDQWWIVDVYVLDTDSGDAAGIIQQRFVRSLKERIPNDLSPPDGLAYERINYYEGHLDGHINRSAADDWWAALNTKTRSSKEKGLRNFFRNAKLHNNLNDLLAIRGLWEAMRIGVLHKITAMHCDEAICCYWEHILRTFLRVAGGRQQLLPYIDGMTVELLESRAPKVSMRDRQFLQKRMDDGQLFANLDSQVRDEVWQNILRIDYPIPTSKTFFKDRLYLEVAQNVMKQALLPVPNDTATTIDAGLCATWDSARSGTIPVRQERLKEGLLELWRFSFQYGFEMTGHIRLKSDKQVPQDGIEAAELWRHFFALMRIRGFKAPDGDSAAAPTMPLPTPSPCEFPENPEHEIEAPKRCGKPYSNIARADRFALTASSMRQRSVPDRVTAGFLRQSVFNAFFSYLQTTATGTSSTTYEVPLQQAQMEVESNQPLGIETVSPVNGHDQPSESTSNEPSSWDTTHDSWQGADQ
ncbi:hypothetical protein N7478_001398 [Penicillium angulare]|uniref:uncharacterized protein n=1 Tax=Penicillium angulare TaxID=116970 RepID=UPI0025414904|nr:uncharacterized protein N7478_001398 [Penicillium angulare]KAJ5292147.1 hypothetical protein N7478_001398 [Penicillium angulare]